MASPPVCTIDAAGCHRPTFEECLAYYVDSYRATYGQDVVLDEDTQDGQWIRLQADALHAANGATLAAYLSFPPGSAQGTGLSRLVKLNGLSRKVASRSTVDLKVVGQAGTLIENGAANGPDGIRWLLPASLLIPYSGEITVTAVCSVEGAVTASAGSITDMAETVRGWQTVTNPAPAVPGSPLENDIQLRARQARSTALPALGLLDGLTGAVLALPNVARLRAYENSEDIPDANGMPGHSISLVVDGGDAAAIAALILRKKGPGVGTYGSILLETPDAGGIPRKVAFFRPAIVPVTYAIQVRNLGGLTEAIKDRIRSELAAWTSALGIGVGVNRDEAAVVAKLNNQPDGRTYKILSLAIGRNAATPSTADAAIAFNEAAACTGASVAVTVVP